MGDPTEARAFKSSQKIPFSLLSDTGQGVYRAYGLGGVNMFEEMQANTVGALFRESMRGNFAGIPVGDVSQLGGTFLIDMQGVARYVRRNKNTTEFPRSPELLRALQAVKF